MGRIRSIHFPLLSVLTSEWPVVYNMIIDQCSIALYLEKYMIVIINKITISIVDTLLRNDIENMLILQYDSCNKRWPASVATSPAFPRP